MKKVRKVKKSIKGASKPKMITDSGTQTEALILPLIIREKDNLDGN
jgi:hypothetical protein